MAMSCLLIQTRQGLSSPQRKSQRQVPDPDFYIFQVLLKFSFSRHSIILCGGYESDPLSPPKGRQPKRRIPLTSSFSEYYFQPSRGFIAIGRCPIGGGGSTMYKEPPRTIVCFFEDFNKAIFQKNTTFRIDAFLLCHTDMKDPYLNIFFPMLLEEIN
jgi:hypothetical protein